MKKSTDLKVFNIRIPKILWKFLKNKSVDREMSMNAIIEECIGKYKLKCDKKLENKLTEKKKVIPLL